MGRASETNGANLGEADDRTVPKQASAAALVKKVLSGDRASAIGDKDPDDAPRSLLKDETKPAAHLIASSRGPARIEHGDHEILADVPDNSRVRLASPA